MEYYIRPAKTEDAHKTVHLIYEAIGQIANRLTGESKEAQVLEKLIELFKRNDNRHAYTNTYVAEHTETKDIMGIIVLYSGKDGVLFDQNLQNWLKVKNAPVHSIDLEAHPDEFYIDTLCVDQQYRSLGLGTTFLQFAEEVAISKGYTKLSLNVEIQKHKAKSLYERLGFVVTEPWTIIQEPFHHMVKIIN